MDEFENRIINGIFTSQYVAAWVKERGECGYHYIGRGFRMGCTNGRITGESPSPPQEGMIP